MKHHQIVILEDDPDIGFILEYYLTDQGFEVTLFKDVTSLRAGYDLQTAALYLLDVQLPDGTGIDICNEIKQRSTSAHIPVVIMSAHAQSDIHKECHADAFLSKPFDLTALGSKISELVA
jgi:DNA-binding response OmpR family regulator